MAIVFPTAGDYLTGDGGATVYTDQDFTVFVQAKELSPSLSGAEYKVIFALFADESAVDYSNPYLTCVMRRVGADQAVLIKVGDGTESVSKKVTLGRYNWFAVTFNATTKDVQFIANGILVDTLNYDYTALSPNYFQTLTVGGDATGSAKGGLAINYLREWNELLTIDQLKAEARSPNAVFVGGVIWTDYPFEVASDLWNHRYSFGTLTANGAPETSLPGSFGPGKFALALCPESLDVYFHNVDLRLRAHTPAFDPDERCVALAVTRRGTVWAAYDSSGITVLRELDTSDGSLVQSITLDILIGEAEGFKALAELPDGSLLSVNRGTGEVISIAVPAGTYAAYGLTIAPLDAALSPSGKKLAYIDGNDLKVWDLVNDVFDTTVKSFAFPVVWPIWLKETELLVCTGSYLQFGDVIRVNLAGDELQTYTWNQDDFSEGLYGIAANRDKRELYLYIDWDMSGGGDETPALLIIDLVSGDTKELLPLVSFDEDFDFSAAVATPPAIGIPQWGGVTAYTHDISKGTIKTTVDLGGQPRGGYRKHITLALRPGTVIPFKVPE